MAIIGTKRAPAPAASGDQPVTVIYTSTTSGLSQPLTSSIASATKPGGRGHPHVYDDVLGEHPPPGQCAKGFAAGISEAYWPFSKAEPDLVAPGKKVVSCNTGSSGTGNR